MRIADEKETRLTGLDEVLDAIVGLTFAPVVDGLARLGSLSEIDALRFRTEVRLGDTLELRLHLETRGDEDLVCQTQLHFVEVLQKAIAFVTKCSFNQYKKVLALKNSLS